MKIQEDDHIPNTTIAKLAEREAGKTFNTFMVPPRESKYIHSLLDKVPAGNPLLMEIIRM